MERNTSPSPTPEGSGSIYSHNARLTPEASPAAAATMSRINGVREDTSLTGLRRSGSGARFSHHSRGKSIDHVRGKWEAKIEAAAAAPEETPTVSRRPKSVLEPRSPALNVPHASSPLSRGVEAPIRVTAPSSPLKPTISTPLKPTSPQPPAPQVVPKVAFPGTEESATEPEVDKFDEFGLPPRLALSSLTGLSSDHTGTSTMRSNRSQADTLADARANALRRLEAKKAAGIPVQEPRIELPALPVAKELDLPPLPILDSSGMMKSTPTRLSKLMPKKSEPELAPPDNVSNSKLEIRDKDVKATSTPPRQRLRSIKRGQTPKTPTAEATPTPEPTVPLIEPAKPSDKEPSNVANAPTDTFSRQRLKSVPRPPVDAPSPAESRSQTFTERKLRPVSMVETVSTSTERVLPPKPTDPPATPAISHRTPLKSIPRAPVETPSPVNSRPPSFAERRLRPVSMIEASSPWSSPKIFPAQLEAKSSPKTTPVPLEAKPSPKVAPVPLEAKSSPKAEPSIALAPARPRAEPPVSLIAVDPSPAPEITAEPTIKRKGSVLSRIQAINQPAGPSVPETARVPSKDDKSVLRRLNGLNQGRAQASKPVIIPGRDAGDITRRVQSIDQAPEVVQTSKAVTIPGRETGHIHRRIQSIDQLPDLVQTSKPVEIPGKAAGHIHKRIQSIDQAPEEPRLKDTTRGPSSEKESAVLRKVKSINQLPTAPQTSKPVVISGSETGSIHRRVQSIDQGPAPQLNRSEPAPAVARSIGVLRKVRSIDQGLRDPAPSEPAKSEPFPKAPSTPLRPRPAPAGGDVFSVAKAAALDSPSKDSVLDSPSGGRPKVSGLGFRAPKGPPKAGSVSSMANRWTAGDATGSMPSRGNRVPSLGSDRRRLGKHLPRIVSGDQGWDGDGRRTSISRVPSSSRARKVSIGGSMAPATESVEENTPPRNRTLSTSTVIEYPSPTSSYAPSERAPSTYAPSERAISFATSERQPLSPAWQNQDHTGRHPTTPRKQSSKSGLNFITPRAEVQGAEMKGLMSAVGAASARAADTSQKDAATGMPNRLRLSSRLPLAASSAAMAPAPLPSRRLAAQNNNWMDRQRHVLAAYEYLCHVGEAQQWIEGCLDEELGFGVTEMEEGLRDGVVLAKLAREFQGEEVVRRIWTEAKHRFRQSDNINYFINFLRTVGMPETFVFELTDLYNAKNIPKVIFSIHVLSHLLARLGRAERMNNLVGQFEFTAEQLAATEKGIQGIAMPNFGQVGQSLAKEASWEEPEPEEEEETEDEKRDRELLECESSIRSLQCHLRGVLARQRDSRKKAQIELAAPIFARVQAQARGQMSRKVATSQKQTHRQLGTWATKLQAVARASMVQRSWKEYLEKVKRCELPIIRVQAAARGKLARMRRANLRKDLARRRHAFEAMQAHARGQLVRQKFRENKQAVHHASTVKMATSMQALLRGRLSRAKVSKEQKVVQAHTPTFISLQSHLRGAFIRRQHRAREKNMDDATDYIVAIQAVARDVLARRRKQVFTREAVKLTTSISSLQALARGRLAKRQHDNMQKALAKVEMAGSVGGLQAFLRTKLAKHKTVEQKKKLEFVQPDVIGFQAVARGFLARREYREWRDYLVDPYTQGALVYLQSLIRGYLCRRKFWMRYTYLHNNQDKITKVQAIWRGRTQRQMYQRLITGGGVDVPTIQHYMHLLDDTENDFGDQLRIDTMKKEVIELVRTNQSLDTEVKELDTKIALILKNKMTFEDLARAKRTRGVPHDEETFHNPGGGDPFVSVHLDRASQRKLELYEHLFFTLQTQPQYISRLLWTLGAEEAREKDCRLVEAVTLILFGFGHDRREEYLFHKLCQISMHEQILRSRSLEELATTRFSIIPVVMQYAKPALKPFLHNALTAHINRIIASDDLDLSTDPVDLYNRLINADEALTGMTSSLPRDLTADKILQTHAETRTIYIHHLQELRALTDFIAKEIMASTSAMPYTIRLLAREALFALRVRYSDHSDSQLWPIVAKSVIMPFIIPALVAPETYDIAVNVNTVQRRNLSAIGMLLGYVAGQDFAKRDRLVQVPLNEYIRAEGFNMGDWILDVAEVDFHVQELLESTTEATPISITRSDIYGLLGILIRNSATLTANNKNDPIKSVLDELEGPPLEFDKSNKTVRVHLTNRLAQLQPSDPKAARLRELEVQAKRHVLAVLRIQAGKDLFEVLTMHPTAADEQRWVEAVHRDIALEQARLARHDLPPTPAEAEYQLESIRSLPFHEVKARAVEFCMALADAGRLSREDHFQGLLVSIAGDIREKHRLRQKRKVDLRAMSEAHANLSDKRQNFEEQIQSYHNYIDTSMANLQQKKKTSFMSRQYWHQRKHKKDKFGSYSYTAKVLYERGILLSVNQFSPRQFDQIHLIMSSNTVGVFSLEMALPTGSDELPREELRMEDLLQAQFDNNTRLDLFDGMAAFNLNTLIHQINKKFYAS
ncbi:hypothetical protein CspHIS471_0409710 [Cutaneotrichosporon sp. HIS471]|nr:hypothetical protein CspHIS471_0409710 [Cutaneotrichosporon sp. HIS471]